MADLMDVPLGVLNGFGVVGLLVGLFWMLATGRLATGRELRDKDDRIAKQAKMIEDQGDQIRMLLNETIPTITSVLVAVRNASERRGT